MTEPGITTAHVQAGRRAKYGPTAPAAERATKDEPEDKPKAKRGGKDPEDAS